MTPAANPTYTLSVSHSARNRRVCLGAGVPNRATSARNRLNSTGVSTSYQAAKDVAPRPNLAARRRVSSYTCGVLHGIASNNAVCNCRKADQVVAAVVTRSQHHVGVLRREGIESPLQVFRG